MKRDYVHFAMYTKPVAKQPRSADELADLIETKIREMQESGEKYGEIRIDMPEDLTEEEVQIFIHEVMKRFGGEDND